MGSWTEFICDNCDYSTEVSGGKAKGFEAVVETMTCHSCRQLVDVLIGRCGQEGPSGDPAYDKNLGRCPKCHGNDLSVWTMPGKCPKCDEQMREGDLRALWD
jgi:hypothetical protein